MISTGSIYIVPKMKDPFDFDEYLDACRVANIRPLTLSHYTQKLGTFMVALRRYKGMKPEDAYMALVKETNGPTPSKTAQGGCSGCGKRKIK